MDMPETEEPDDMREPRPEDDERFLLADRREIVRVLQSLVEARALMTANLAPRPFAFATCLVEVSLEADTVTIDGSRDEAINAKVLQSDHLTCTARLASVPIRFRLAHLRRAGLDGMAVFAAPLPGDVLYLQRRQSHRLPVPPGGPMLFVLNVQEGAPHDKTSLQQPLQVFDISAGGVGVMLDAPRSDFVLGAQVDCLLQLPDALPLGVRLAVRSCSGLPGTRDSEKLRVGCEFVCLPRAIEAQIQRYIFAVERRRTARRRGEG